MHKINNILTSAAFVLFTGLAALSSNVIASTPDGETPANEGVCDVLHGGTPGLYGLCVAYCEAQDLDTFDKKPPSVKILANYNRKMQAGDPAMPCMQPVCPCWTDAELASISRVSSACNDFGGSNALQILSSEGFHLADTDTAAGAERCRYIDTIVKPAGMPIVRSFDIKPEEAQSCYSILQTACGIQ